MKHARTHLPMPAFALRLLCTCTLAATLVAGTLVGCSSSTPIPSATDAQAETVVQDDIVVLFTNDVHCGISDDIGYAGLAAYRNRMLERTDNVTLVDLGDAIQGDVLGTLSDGQIIVDIMNEVDYDLAILGNHEFDYGMTQLGALISDANADYLACNITYTGKGINALTAVEPYRIIEYDNIKVAYIGVTTPESITSSTPSYFMEHGEYVYDFCAGADGNDLYNLVQGYVDECREAGADYVVALTHLGDTEDFAPYSSIDLIHNTEGIDAVLDGHAHSVIPCQIEGNIRGEEVLLASTGTKLNNIGQLTISAEGELSVGLISGYASKDSAIEAFVEEESAAYQSVLGEVVATSDTALSINDENGVRLVRNRETTIGNLCADAYRSVSGAQIAFVNGGGIRDDLPAGNIIFADVIAVHPFGNTLCMVEATGQEILDLLELASSKTEAEASADGVALGEDGTFQQVSGLRYTIDTSIESSVVLDENANFVSVEGDRRVKNVRVMGPTGAWEPLDPEGVYTVASHNYLIKEGGGGATMFMDNELLINEGMLDYQMLITYIIEDLQGNLSEKYSATENRITVL